MPYIHVMQMCINVLLDIIIMKHYFLVVSVRGYHWVSLHTINICFLHGKPMDIIVLYSVLYNFLCVVSKALTGNYT